MGKIHHRLAGNHVLRSSQENNIILSLYLSCFTSAHDANFAAKCSAETLMTIIVDEGVTRVTASLSRRQEQVLKELRVRHKVSVAWLIRYAVDQLVEQGREAQLPFDFARRV